MKGISERVKGIAPSATLAITAKAKEMKKRGVDVVSFGAGEPDFDPPNRAKREARKASKEGPHTYSPVGGMPELKNSIAMKMKRFGMDYEPKEIIVSNGAKHTLFNICLSLLNPGEEAVLFAPYWVTYEEQIKFAGGKPVIIQTDESTEFVPTEEQLRSAINDKTKFVLINSPSNPTGAMLSEKHLRMVCGISLEHDAYIVSDEIYGEIYFGKKPVRVPTLSSEIKERTIYVDGVAKTYAMPGWRVGWCAGPPEIVKAMDNLQSHATSNVCNAAQRAAVAALEKDIAKKHVRSFKERRDFVMKEFESHGWTCFNPKGAFYAFPNIKRFGMDSIKFSDMLLEKAKVAVVPGIAFGSDAHVRMAFATSQEKIEEGLKRIFSIVH